MQIRRREFVAGLAASALFAPLWTHAQDARRRPRQLIAEEDPFTGLALLKTRYAAGRRPSNDVLGWALSWRLTGQNTFADRTLAELRPKRLPAEGKASRTWLDYARWALAFDWLFDYPAFDRTLRDRIAHELVDGASAILTSPAFADPSQVEYHNYDLRYLALAVFPLAAVEGYADFDERCRPLRAKTEKAFANILEVTNLVTPEGSYHESLDYMRITWASLTLLSELQRTTKGIDPAHHFPVFQNIGDTYLYKLLPDGTPSREGDNEYPILDSRDTALLGYAVNRFKDPYSAWLLRKSGFLGKEWVLPVLEFLWDDPEVTPRDAALATESELPRQRCFPGVGHLVIRNGWKPDSTWIEFDCGPYFSKHQHLDQNQFTIYNRGYLAIDSGADYTDTESPHYLNYYRRTVAHNSVLVYDPAEKFFWSDNLLAAANDGGQRMNSSRYWNTIRSPKDWERTRDLWDLGTMRVLDYVPGQYHYALGDATKAYSSDKVKKFTREILYAPAHNLLFVFDSVVSTNASLRKAWLLHGVNEPSVDQDSGQGTAEAKEFRNANTFCFRENKGELLVHLLLPRESVVTRRGGPGNEFYTPGNDQGGPWGSGENWPLNHAQGGPLPQRPKLLHLGKTFWGEDLSQISPSNRRNVVPGAWRIEVSPSLHAEEDFFLHVFEIGDLGTTGKRKVALMEGVNFAGAVSEQGPCVLFARSESASRGGEVSLPDLACTSLTLSSLRPNSVYELRFYGPNVTSSATAALPGVETEVLRVETNPHGILRINKEISGNIRLRIAAL